MEHKTKRTKLSKDEAITVMQKFCAYQERSQQEVRSRLIEHQVYGHAVEEIIAELITQDFINEERFAQAYTRGKFRIKKWGKHKILAMLKFHKISPYSIKKAFLEIDNDEYFDTLKSILIHKKDNLLTENNIELKRKLVAYAQQKGYEVDLIYTALEDII